MALTLKDNRNNKVYTGGVYSSNSGNLVLTKKEDENTRALSRLAAAKGNEPVAAKSAAKPKNVAQAITQGDSNVGGTFLGGYKQPVTKEKRVPTATEIAAQQKEADDAAKYIEYLKALDLDSQQTKIDALKGSVDAAPKYNIRAFGGYDPNSKTVDETALAKAQEDYNLARSIQYSEKGKEALGALDSDIYAHVDNMALWKVSARKFRKATGKDNVSEDLQALYDAGLTLPEIEQLVDYRKRQINEDEYVKKVQKMEELAASEDFLGISDAGAVAASVASVPLNLGSGLGYLDLLRQKAYFKNAGYDRPLDYNTAAMSLYGQADAARSTVSQRIMDNAETEFGGEVGAFLYQTGMSMADSAVVATLGGLGLGAGGTLLLGGSAATAAAVDAKNRGGSDEQALLSGAFAGAAETVFEKVSIDNLLKTNNIKNILGGEFRQLVSDIGKQSLVEGSEELFTEFANFISDQLIMGGSSAYEQSVREYVAQGMTEDEARAKAAGDFAIDCATAFIGGAISGGIMGGTVSAGRMDTGNDIRKAYAQAYAEDTLRTAPESPVATQVMEKVNEGKKVSGRDIKKLERENQQAVEKARRESAMAEVEELKKPPTARVDNLTLSDGRKVTNYTTDDDGTPVWLTDNGTVRGGEVDSTTVGQANKWGGNIGRVIVEQDDGSEGYASNADALVEMGIHSVDNRAFEWSALVDTNIVQEIGVDKAFTLYNAGVSAARSPVFRSYYRAGILGDSFDSVDVKGKWVSNTVKQMAYEMGQFAAKNEKAYTAKQSKNAGFRDNSAAAQKLSKKTRSALDRIGKTLGVEIRFAVESDHMGEKENGRYDPSTATIIISPNAANPAMVVVAHEVTHRMQELYGKEYKAYRRFVVRAIEKNTGTTAVTALRDRYNNYYREAGRLDSFGDIDAMDELVADYTMAMIENGTLFRDLAQEHRSIAKRLLDALKRVIDRLTGKEQYTLYGTTVKEMREAQRLWERMLEGEGTVWDAVVGTKKAAEDGGVRHSLIETKVAEAVHDAMDHRDGGHDNLIKIGQIPSAIADISGITGDLYIYRNHAYENTVSRKQAEEEGYPTSGEHFHALGEEKMIDALVAINKPYLAIAQTSRRGTPALYLVLPQFAEDGVPLSAAIDFYVDTPINGMHGVRPHVTVTIYARPFDGYIDDFNKPHAGLIEMINDAIKNKKVLLIDKKIRADVPVTAKRTSLGSVTTSALEKNVAQFKQEVKEFKEKNKIRYSLKDSDGNALTEEQAAYFAESKSVDAQGNLRVMYRGGNSGFTVFDRKKSSYANLYGRGFYFTDSKSHAEQYGGARAFYLNITNPVPTDETTITKEQLLAFLRAVAENEDDYSFENYGYGETPESVVDAIYSGKSDFAMLYDVSQSAIGDMVDAVELFNEINGTDFDGLILDTETVTFRSEQAKLTSNKTPTDDPDIRFSLKSDAAMGRTLRDMAEAQNATEKAVKAWVADVHRGKKVDVNIDEAERVAQNLINDYRSSADKFEVTGAVLDLFNYLQNGDGIPRKTKTGKTVTVYKIDEVTVQEKANTVADILLSAEMRGRYYAADFVETPNGMELSDAAQDNEELRKFLRGTKIVFPKEYVSDLGEENWTAFKEGLKGAQARLSDENNRANVDTLYREDLSRMWPQYFPDSVTGEAAMMQRIAEVSQRVFERTNRAHSEGEIEAMMQMTASDILDRFFNLPQVGKTYISVRNLREKSTRTVRRLQDQLQVRDSQGSRASIIRKVKALDKKLRDNTEKSHVPDYLRSAVLELCSLFTQNTSVFSMNQLAKIKLQYDHLKRDEYLQYIFDEDISGMLEELADTLDGRRLSELTGKELQWVDDIVSHFTHLVNNANQAFMDDKRVAVEKMANRVISKAVTDDNRTEIPLIPKIVSSGNIKPYYFFKDIGGQMQELFEDLLRGQSRYGRLMNEAKQFQTEVYKKYNADKWLDSDKKLEMTTEHGDKIVLDVNEVLSILATFKREVTNREQDAGHLTHGGIVYEDEMKREVDNNKKLSVKALINKVLQKPDAKAKPLSMGDVLEISKWLRQNVSEQAEAFVDEMVSYLSLDMAELGNETSMKLTGIRKYNERYYFPYKVSSVYLASKLRDPNQSPALRSPGFSKRTQYKANNPIVLRGFTDVWSEHVSEMLTYATMAVPQDTLLRVLNYNDATVDVEDNTNAYKNVKEVMTNTYGKRAVEYIEQLLRDMNGGVAIDEREKAASQLVRIYKKNAVGLSVSVAIQQPSSAARAMAEVDTKYFFNVSHKGDYEQLKKYSGVAVIKEMGGFDTNLGRGGATWLKGEDSIIEQAIGFLPQKMDQFTWAYLWNVVKAETRDKHPDLLDNGKETEAFLYAAGRRFDEVVEKTQVYDSVLTRSENMRSKSGLGNLFLSFMSEPMVTLNMAVDAVRSKDGKRMARVGGSLLVSIVLNNVLKALWTAGRDDEEEKTYLEKLLYRFNNYMSSDVNPLSYIPIVKYVDDIIKGYGTSIDLFEPWTDLIEKYNKASEKTQDFGVRGVFSEETMDFLLAIPSLFGVPLDNVKRDVETIINLCSKMAPIDEATKRDLLNAFREGWGTDSSLKKTLRDGWRNKDNERKRKSALADIEAAYQDKVRGYQKKGKTLKEAQQSAKSSIQSSCTNYLKPIYQSLTGAKKNEVKQFALRISVGGKQLYADYDFSKWDE